jgi:SAM-dependent methyltransferase
LALEDHILSILKNSPSDQYSIFRELQSASMSDLTKALAGLQKRKMIAVSGYRKSKRTGLDIPLYSLKAGHSHKLDVHGLLAGVTSERLVEYDFVSRHLMRRGKKARILDIGSNGSDLRRLVHEFGGSGWQVVGVDLAQEGCEARMDARNIGFRTGAFDQVISISTLEHIGLSDGILDENGDARTMEEIRRVLKRNGTAIVTVPYGGKAAIVEPTHRVYDRRTLAKLAKSFSILKMEFYRYANGKWKRCSQMAAGKSEGSIPLHFHSGACACLLLRKVVRKQTAQADGSRKTRARKSSPVV